jgi:ABC-type lipoprotein export system ATPase subunit/ABC-type antimicrobial peptide transport system permease subunit
MIRLEKVNKYFNRHHKNEIHVINNTSLTFPSSGLVALLGPSGCGKTTILNAIGGLDKINSGKIYIDGQKISRKCSSKVDKIRNLNIGYIFQDYKLVEGMSVFDNVALSLKLIGIKDKEEIKKRVLYTLEKVNMARYKNRPVNMLSGGERQRVGIARSLVKNPKIIIADEPTGNLDSKNSIEIMNIIKSISNKYLVVLVTHEEELAKFYADRIIELKDGQVINDYENTFAGSLNYEIENRIYLQDYKNIDNLTKDNINIQVYRDNNEDTNIKVVFKNGNIYIATNGNEKVEVVENNSNIELIDDHYKEIDKVDVNENTFNIESISNDKYIPKYSSIFRFGSFITNGFKKLLDYPIIKKILLAGFFLSGIFIFYAISSIFATIEIDDTKFIEMNKEYIVVNNRSYKVDDYLAYEKLEEIDYLLPSNSIVGFEFKYDKYIQTENQSTVIKGSLSPVTSISKDDIVLGRMAQNDNEIVIDKMLIKETLKESKQAGFINPEDLLNHDIYLKNMSNYTIVGITDKKEPNIYANKESFINMIANSNLGNLYDEDNSKEAFVDYELVVNNKVKLVKGKLPLNDYEVIVNNNYRYEMPLNKMIKVKINGKKLRVVGYYEPLTGNTCDDYLVNNNTIKYDLIKNTKILTIYSKDKDKVLKYFKDKKMNVYESYKYSQKKYYNDIKDNVIASLILSSIILGISLIEILLMIRSSFLSRIKEVGIYRAIGVKKSDIYKMFAGEIIAITTIGSVTGIAFMTYVLDSISKIPYLGDLFKVNLFTFGISVILVYLFNLIVGLIPVYNTIRKTPAQILSRFDVD